MTAHFNLYTFQSDSSAIQKKRIKNKKYIGVMWSLLTDSVSSNNDFSILGMAVVVGRFSDQIRRFVTKQVTKTVNHII